MPLRFASSPSGILVATLLVLAGIAADLPPAAAQEFDVEARRCSDEKADPDARIETCTWLLGSKELSQESVPATHYNRGNAYYDRGQYDRAVADYDEAIRLNFDEADVYANRGDAHRRTGRYDRAIQDLDRAIRLNPNDPNTFVNRGLAYEGKGQHDQAIEDYDRAIRLEPNDAVAYYNRGLAYERKLQYDRAIQDFEQAIRLSPDHAGAYYHRGLAYGRKVQYDRAIQDFDHAIRLNSDDADAYHGRGLAHRYKGQYDHAIEDYDRAIGLNPNYAGAYNSLAWLRATAKEARFRDGAEAVRLARKAVEIEAKNTSYYDTLAAAYVEAGETERALAAYRHAMVLGGEQRVRSYQDYLRKNGFYGGSVDGLSGPVTEAALKACIEAGCKLLAD